MRPIRLGESTYDYLNKVKAEKERRAERTRGFPNSHRVTIDGVVVSEMSGKFDLPFPGWAKKMEEQFATHLRNAIQQPDTFLFEGFGKPMNAEEYLRYHSEQSGVPIGPDSVVGVIPPGEDRPLAPGKVIS